MLKLIYSIVIRPVGLGATNELESIPELFVKK